MYAWCFIETLTCQAQIDVLGICLIKIFECILDAIQEDSGDVQGVKDSEVSQARPIDLKG